jgi:hypothetical protein
MMEFPVISWRDLPYRSSIGALHPMMLSPNGHKVYREIKPNGRGVKLPPKPYYVVYDRDYVLDRLDSLIDELCIDMDEFLELVNDAYVRRENQMMANDIAAEKIALQREGEIYG